ncbi:CCR4-NOT transcription complex subunit 4 [Hypsibius exemplaris]|uniref:CCR4-NOT transcription complex subunit 4 n=1 Tax=Hypsibius exemplaris TaxID=2072580 RepID=A0A1W0WBN5_HYPEX|nr:CCR4-NOT transcription complex subunit 4 [Hypsibius exemplaris]
MTMDEQERQSDNGCGDDCVECPLCMEPLDLDDISFFPCTCGYQVCKFCWHRIRTDENGLCPACRQKYPDDPVGFKPVGTEEMQRYKSRKLGPKPGQKKRDPKEKIDRIVESRKHLTTIRVVQKNLVFVIGLPPKLTDAEVLRRPEYFGKFGRIIKVMVNTLNANGTPASSASAYITYLRSEDSLRAIKTLNNLHVDGRILKASLGTTKYCVNFLRNLACTKAECMYLHDLGDGAASFTKEEMQQNKHQEYEKQLLDSLNPIPPAVALELSGRLAAKNIGVSDSVPIERPEMLTRLNPPLSRDMSPSSSCSLSSSSGSLNEPSERASPAVAFDLFVDTFDDFGFDPWNESSKGLADLMELESQTRRTAPSHVSVHAAFGHHGPFHQSLPTIHQQQHQPQQQSHGSHPAQMYEYGSDPRFLHGGMHNGMTEQQRHRALLQQQQQQQQRNDINGNDFAFHGHGSPGHGPSQHHHMIGQPMAAYHNGHSSSAQFQQSPPAEYPGSGNVMFQSSRLIVQ